MTAPIIYPATTYSANGEATAITAATYLFEGRAAAGESFRLEDLLLTNDLNLDEVVAIEIARYGTAGATGTAMTENPDNPDFGTSLIEWVSEPGTAPTVQTGFIHVFEWNLKTEWRLPRALGIIPPTDSLAIRLVDAPSASVNIRGVPFWSEFVA